jgi:hypothetical protein
VKRPAGYTVIALLLILWSMPQLAGTLVRQPATFGVALPPWRHVLDGVAGVAALIAGIALCNRRGGRVLTVLPDRAPSRYRSAF